MKKESISKRLKKNMIRGVWYKANDLAEITMENGTAVSQALSRMRKNGQVRSRSSHSATGREYRIVK